MEWLLGLGAAVDWGAVRSAVWGWGSYVVQGTGHWAAQASRGATAFLIGLPRECQLASIHAAAICAGESPQYFTVPGFPPIAVSWGWLVSGITIGLAMGIWCMTILWVLCNSKRNNDPMPPPPPFPWPTPRERAQLEVLRALRAGGRAALGQMAAQNGRSETEFLYHLAGVPPPHAGGPAPGGVGYAPY